MLFILCFIIMSTTNQYEFVIVIDTTLNAKDIEKCRDSALELLEKANATIKETDEMGLVPLAYPLNGNMQ